MWTAKTLIRLGRCQADLSLRWAHTHFVGFVMRRLIYFFRSESVDLRMMMSIKVIMLQLGLTAFDFLRLLIQFIIRGNNTFGMGVWYGTVVWYGIFVPYYIPNHRTIPGFTVCHSLLSAEENLGIKQDSEMCYRQLLSLRLRCKRKKVRT